MIRIVRTNSNFEREPFLSPFGFKGGYVDELWQIAARMESEAGSSGVGLGAQSVLWSDADIFVRYGQNAGNSLMYLMTEFALKTAKGLSFETPLDLMDQLIGPVYSYGQKITCNNKLRMTFALNSLVAVDNAAWMLYSREKGIHSFDQMIPQEYRQFLKTRHDSLASVPLISYGVSLQDMMKSVQDGYFFLKIKIGADPDKDGNLDKMLEWDKNRLSAIHEALKDIEIPYTANGRIPYYLDANGRYDSKDRLMSFLEHADHIGALDRIMILEEPFPEELIIDVSSIPVRLAADESAHSDRDAIERIEQGYKAIALKPIAKTLSMSLKIAKVAHERNVPCFCADLTVNPIMVDWNKNVAARLEPLPGMKVGVLESNGHQNYRNWYELKKYHPLYGAKWMETVKGLFQLDEDFYAASGGIFEDSLHYSSLVNLDI